MQFFLVPLLSPIVSPKNSYRQAYILTQKWDYKGIKREFFREFGQRLQVVISLHSTFVINKYIR